MGLLRDIFRIGQSSIESDIDTEASPVYPPEDTLTFGFEEVFVTLALLVISYLILATPCFPRRLGQGLNSGEWVQVAKQIRHVRNKDDLKQWWEELMLSRERDATRRRRNNFDAQRYDKLIRNYNNNNGDLDKTIRARGGGGGNSYNNGGRSAPTSPLRSFFRPLAPASLAASHKNMSDGNLLSTSPTRLGRYKTPSEFEGSGSAGLNGGAEEDDSSQLYEDDNLPKPETDNDRFQKAWQSQIRFAPYRRLVLPPECKLVEFPTTTSNWREIEQTLLDNLLDESRWKKIISCVRNFFDMIYKVVAKLLSKESTERVSTRLMDIFRYRIRKQRGLSVDEDDDTDDEDDGSVASSNPWSSVGKRLFVKTPSNSIPLPEGTTPVTSNKQVMTAGKGPPLQCVPQLVHDSPKPTDGEEHDNNNVSPQSKGSNENDPSCMNVPQSVRPRFASASDNLFTDDADASFVSASGLENSDTNDSNRTSPSRSFDIPTSVDRSPKKPVPVSPLPTKQFANKLKKKDALENYRKPDIMPIIMMPSLKTSEPQTQQEEIMSPLNLSPKLAPKNRSDTNLAYINDNDITNLNFFDTANSSRQLRDMSRAVPIPDSNGYILGDEFLPSSCTPLLVFVNSRSGPQQGNLLITQFRQLLNPMQVWDLANGGPEKILKSFSILSRYQVLICGGDGTVSWVISALEKMELKRWPPIAILPLGTGNDLARIHGWGGGYNNESLLLILRQISEAYISMLDLWELDITSTSKKGKQRNEVKSFLNYLGVGVDAQAALQVHNLRESKPKLFFSRFFNKTWYAIAGGEEAIKSSCANLSEQITLVADGVEIPLPADSQGIIFLNIDSYSGGVPMWAKGLKPKGKGKRVRRYSEGDFTSVTGGLVRNDSIEDLADLDTSRELTACDLPSSCQDGLLDVVSIRGTFHLGQIRVGLSNAQLLCQCRSATITLKKKIAMQIDGEPWRQHPSTLQIRRKPDRATMLHRSPEDSGGVETEVTKLLNWAANERKIIDQDQYAKMMEEFSRRVEYKKRSQKERGKGFSFGS